MADIEVTVANGRVAWIDNVKMVAMLFVILGHTWRIIHSPQPKWLSLFILSFNMALFVVMTGYTSVNAMKRIGDITSLWNYIFKIAKRILVPSLVFSLFLTVVLHIVKTEIKPSTILCVLIIVVFAAAYRLQGSILGRKIFNVICILAIPLSLKLSVFWFFSMIWCVLTTIAVSSLLLHSLRKNLRRDVLLYILSFTLSLLFNYLHDKTSDFIHFFMIGYVLSNYGFFDGMYNKCCTCWTVLWSVLGISLISLLGEPPMNFWDSHFIDMLQAGNIHLYILRIVSSTTLCLSFMLLIRLFSQKYNRFSFWGGQTLAMYLVHGAIVSIFYETTISYKIGGMSYLLYAIPMTLVLTKVSIIIIKFFMRYKLTRAYCLGEIK